MADTYLLIKVTCGQRECYACRLSDPDTGICPAISGMLSDEVPRMRHDKCLLAASQAAAFIKLKEAVAAEFDVYTRPLTEAALRECEKEGL